MPVASRLYSHMVFKRPLLVIFLLLCLTASMPPLTPCSWKGMPN